jgi:hypothetical protein
MRLNHLIKYFLLINLLVISDCSTPDLSKYAPDAYIIKGRIQYLEVEGGCWSLLAENGERFELNGSNIGGILKNGAFAELVVRNIEDIATICMVGKSVEVLEIIQLSQL